MAINNDDKSISFSLCIYRLLIKEPVIILKIPCEEKGIVTNRFIFVDNQRSKGTNIISFIFVRNNVKQAINVKPLLNYWIRVFGMCVGQPTGAAIKLQDRYLG